MDDATAGFEMTTKKPTKAKPKPQKPSAKPKLLPPPGLLQLGTDKKGNATAWSIKEDGIDISVDGACPVQGEGTVDGHDVYFRARGESWSLEISANDEERRTDPADGWLFEAGYGDWPEAGWMSGKHSKQCFMSAVNAWRKAGGPRAKRGQLKFSIRWPIPTGPDWQPTPRRARA